MLRVFGPYPWTQGTLFFVLLVVIGITTFIGLIHSFRVLYHRWLTFAGFLQGVVVAVLFGACYLFVVPWFALAAHVIRRSRRRMKASSFWLPRNPAACDESYFTRMG